MRTERYGTPVLLGHSGHCPTSTRWRHTDERPNLHNLHIEGQRHPVNPRGGRFSYLF